MIGKYFIVVPDRYGHWVKGPYEDLSQTAEIVEQLIEQDSTNIVTEATIVQAIASARLSDREVVWDTPEYT